MKKKKVLGMCLAMGIMASVIGGSLAWFTDMDMVTNQFTTGSDGEVGPDGKQGLAIVEDFDQTAADKMLPGTNVKKEVQVENRANYSQYVRVKLKKVWKDKQGQQITDVNGTPLKDEYIEMTLVNLGDGADQWKEHDGYYYYTSPLAESDGLGNGGADTSKMLLEKVKLSDQAGNEYKDIKFDVVVEAESVQAENNAADDVWGPF